MESVLSAELYVVPLVERIASMMAPSRNPRTVAIHSCRDGIRDGRPRFAVKLRAIHARQQRDRAVCRGRTVLGERVCPACIVLLCHKNGCRQQGHLGSERARWVAIWRRRVAMECGLCRSVLMGSATGLGAAGQAG